MQMIATKKEKGFLCYYLTAPIDQDGYKEEYDIPLEDRYKILEVDKLDLFEKELFIRFDEFKSLRDSLYLDLIISENIDDITFFEICKTKKVTKLKDKSNLTTWGGSLVTWRNEYYVVE